MTFGILLSLLLADATSIPTPISDASRGASLVATSAAAGDSLAVEAWKTGGAWTLRVRDPLGVEVASVTWREPPVITLSWIALKDGRHDVDCEPAVDSGAACELAVIGRDAKGRDSLHRSQLEAALRRGYELLGAWSQPSTWRAEQVFKDAYNGSRTLGLADLQVDSLVGLATAHQLAGEAKRSLSVLETAIARAEESGDQRRFVLAAGRLAAALATLGENDKAKPHLDAAMRVAVETGFLLGAADARLGLGDVHYFRSELPDALREYEAALQDYQRLGNTEGVIEAHLGIGYASADLSRDAHAKSHFERALALARSSGDKRREAAALRVLGNVHSLMTNEREAIRHFQAAQALFEQAGDQAALVALFNSLGVVHGRLNDLAAAIEYHRQAESLSRSTGIRFTEGLALVEIAKYQRRLGHLEDATSSYTKARELFDSIGDPALAATALAGLGDVAMAEGRSEAAVQHYQTALDTLRPMGVTRLSSSILIDLAEADLSMGLADRARDAASEALRLAGETTDSLKEAQALFLLARVSKEKGALEEAKSLAERSLSVGESVRARVPGHELRALFFEDLEARYTFYVDVLMDLERARPEAPFERLAFEAAERGRARVLLDRLREAAATPARGDAESLERERALREQIRAQALQEDLGVRDGGDQSDRRLSEMLAELRRVEGLSLPGLAESVSRRPTLTLEEIQTRLADTKTMLLAYCLGPERSYVWAISRDHATAHVLPPREALERQARDVYGLLTARQQEQRGLPRERSARAREQDARFVEAASLLAKTLLGPIDNLDSFERLVVVADGMLNYIPFSALPHPRSPQGGDYLPLVLSHEVVRAPSLSVLVAIQHASQQGGNNPRGGHDAGARIVVFADPVFTADDPRIRGHSLRTSTEHTGADMSALSPSLRGVRQSLATLPRLLASREEAASIAKASPGTDVTILTDFRVNRASAEEALRDSHKVVHFAAHGIFNDEHPALSGIITSLVDERGLPQDGFLRAQDVYSLEVTADLVVLSACETALGKMLRGEGITGLVHAFLHAGAHTVVASKWRVDDVATQELMSEFYRRMLADGVDTAAALRSAQIKLFRRPRTRAPFFWAAFEVHGLSYGLFAETYRPSPSGETSPPKW
ncbi:MAG TPA: CHAT domain-containing tetratricopeptide repeat protein [Vicinamibacteria bacterium]|nr:CHAT domain-containing tetratricopeptide repeat protein [Vicinamibacteria bacterium]